MLRFSPVLLFATVLLSGCSGCDKGKEKAKRESSLPLTVGLAKDRVYRADGGLRTMAGFKQRLEEEAKARTDVPLKADAVLAELEKQNIPLERKRQQLAASHLARYCMSGHAGQRVQITVCEHESEERAEEYVKNTQKLERPERRIARIGVTSMLIRRDITSEDEVPLVERAFKAFESLADAGKP